MMKKRLLSKAKFYICQQIVYISIMKTIEEIKSLFNNLPIGLQNTLLGELLIEQ